MATHERLRHEVSQAQRLAVSELRNRGAIGGDALIWVERDLALDLMAYHFDQASTVPGNWIPVFYAIAMATGGAGSLVFGRLFDRVGLRVLVPLTLVSALFAPLAFLGGF